MTKVEFNLGLQAIRVEASVDITNDPHQPDDSERDLFVRILRDYSDRLRIEPESVNDALFCALASSYLQDDPMWLDTVLFFETEIFLLKEAFKFGIDALYAEIAETERFEVENNCGLSSALLNDILEVSLMVEVLEDRFPSISRSEFSISTGLLGESTGH